MSNLSPAALALEADLCLLTRLPLPKDANLDAIKERVFGATEGPPRTEDESRRRYVDAIVDAFDASEAESLEDFPVWVRDLSNGRGTLISTINALNAEMLHRNGLTAKLRQERDQARSDADRYGEGLKAAGAARRKERKEQEQLLAEVKAERDALRQERDDARAEVHRLHHDVVDAERRYEVAIQLRNDAQKLSAAFEKENAAFRKALEDRLKEQGEAPMNADHRDLILARRRANDLELEVSHLRTENANLKDSAHALTAERDRLAARVREHEETLAVLSNVNAELFKAQQERDGLRAELQAERASLRASKQEASSAINAHGIILQDLVKARAAYTERTAAHDQLVADMVEKNRLMRDLNEALDRARNRVQELQAETVEQENRYNHLALVVVDLLKGRGVE